MTIEQLKAEGDRVEGVIAGLRKESRARAAVLDQKLKLVPIKAGPLDQMMVPSGDLTAKLRALPADVKAAMKKFFTEGDN